MCGALLQRVDSNYRPLSYEPSELTAAPRRDFLKSPV